MERSVAEMDAVVQALGLNRFHIFGKLVGRDARATVRS